VYHKEKKENPRDSSALKRRELDPFFQRGVRRGRKKERVQPCLASQGPAPLSRQGEKKRGRESNLGREVEKKK